MEGEGGTRDFGTRTKSILVGSLLFFFLLLLVLQFITLISDLLVNQSQSGKEGRGG
jgi:hypothetical protein